MYSSTLSLTSAPGGDEWSRPHQDRFTLGEGDPIAIVQEAGWAPRLASTGAKKSWILYRERPARSESFYKQADTPTNVKDHTSSWEANSRSPSQENPHLLRNQNIHCHVHEGLPFFPIHSLLYPGCTIPSYFFMIHFNIIFLSTFRSSKRSLSYFQITVLKDFRPISYVLYNLPTQIFGKDYKFLSP
jgi:hypothetical protein